MQPSDRVKNKNLDLLYSALHMYGEIEDAFVGFMNVSGLSIKYYKEVENIDLGVVEIRPLLANTVSLIDTGRDYLTALLTHIFDDARPVGVSYSAYKKGNFIPNLNVDSLSHITTATKDDSIYPGYDSQSLAWRRLLSDLRRGTPPNPPESINKSLRSREASFEALDKVEDYLNRYDDIVKQLPDNGFGYTLVDPNNHGHIVGSQYRRMIRNDVRQVKVMKRIISENLVKLRQILNNLPDAEEK